MMRRLEAACAGSSDLVRPHGIALLEGTCIRASQGWTGLTWAAPSELAASLAALGLAAAADCVMTNDPFAGGLTLDRLLLAGPADARGERIVACLECDDIGAMRADVFCREREIFHEGVRLVPRAVAPSGPAWPALASLIAANLRHGDLVLRAIAAACAVVQAGTAPRAPGFPPLRPGRAMTARVDGVRADLGFGSHAPALRLSLDGPAAACPRASIRSAAALGVADAWGMPPWQVLQDVRIALPETGPLNPAVPSAVAGGAPLAASCYAASFAAAGGAMPRAGRNLKAALSSWA